MDDVLSNFDLVLQAFWLTIQLLVLAGVASLVWGTVLGAMRVGPVAVLRRAGAVYVSVVRNTPLLIVFVFVFIAAPTLGWFVTTPFLVKGVVALTIYTSAFVCEAVRSGINSVSTGQAEAARSIGLGFSQSLRYVILPQALRTVVPPLGSVIIAMIKNSAIAGAFGVGGDLFSVGTQLTSAQGYAAGGVLTGVLLGYLVLTIPAGLLLGVLERKVAIAR